MKRYAIALLLPLLASCGETITDSERWRYDKDVTLRLVVTSAGGALGEERYRVWYRYRDQTELFFNAASGTNFAVKRDGKSVVIQFCNATIDNASPIWLGEPRNELIHVRLITDCPDHP